MKTNYINQMQFDADPMINSVSLESYDPARFYAHTPGPWYAVQYANFISIQKAKEYSEETILDLEYVTSDELEANGKLIAAAPELFRCLRHLLQTPGLWESLHPEIQEDVKKTLDAAGTEYKR